MIAVIQKIRNLLQAYNSQCPLIVKHTVVECIHFSAPTNNSSYIGRVISFYFVFVFVFVFQPLFVASSTSSVGGCHNMPPPPTSWPLTF